MATKPENTEVLLQATLKQLLPWAIMAFAVGFGGFIYTRFAEKKKTLVICQDQLKQRSAELKKVEEARKPEPEAAAAAPLADDGQLSERLKRDLEGPGVEMGNVRGALTLSFYDPTLFNPGESDLTEQGEEMLRRLGEILRGKPGRLFLVAAHTDDAPSDPSLRDLYPTAWELSAARAINVVRFLIDEGRVAPSTLMAASFGASRPLGSNATALGRAKNRRVEISLLADGYKPPPDADPPGTARPPEPSRDEPRRDPAPQRAPRRRRR